MFRLTTRQRENTGRVLLSMITVDLATLIGGNIFNLKGFQLPIFFLGCILFVAFYIFLILVDR